MHPDTLAARASLAAAYDAAGQMGAALQRTPAGLRRDTSGRSAPTTPSPWPARPTWPAPTTTAGQLGDAVALLRDGIARAELALSPDDPVTRALRQACLTASPRTWRPSEPPPGGSP